MSVDSARVDTGRVSPARGEHRSSPLHVGAALALRSVSNIFRVPGAFVPILVMPLFFLIAFSGSFSGLARNGLLPTDNMLNWVTPYAMVQGAAFAGMGTAFAVARDLEGGFYDRLLLAPSPRRSLLFGPMFAAALRTLFPMAIVLPAALAFGARLTDGVLSLVTLLIAIEGIAMLSAFWGLGIALRFKSQRSLALVQTAIFVAMFLSSAQVPISSLTSWLKPVAQLNPVSNILRLARQGFLPSGVNWEDTWGGLVAIAGLGALLGWFAIRGVRKLDT